VSRRRRCSNQPCWMIDSDWRFLSGTECSCHRYCDTHTGDWLIDYHPDFDNLVVATGDSGEYILAVILRRIMHGPLDLSISQPACILITLGPSVLSCSTGPFSSTSTALSLWRFVYFPPMPSPPPPSCR
jgi:hypothetical protein